MLFGLRASTHSGRRSTGFPACLVDCLLDVSHALLDMATDLLSGTLHLQFPAAGQLSNSLLDLADDSPELSFDLILVHSNLRIVRTQSG
jgi:hypothetical protein